jgi:hypothetical protein
VSAAPDHIYPAEEILSPISIKHAQADKPAPQTSSTKGQADIAPWCQELIATGRARGHNYDSRSEAVYAVCCELARHSISVENIVEMLCDPANAISESILEKGTGASSYARRQAERGHEAVENDFVRVARVIDPKASKNVAIALRRLGVSLSLDQFAHRLEIIGLEDFGPQLDDAAVERLFVLCETKFGFRPEFTWFYRVIRDIARRDAHHPVKRYLDALVWDRQPRVDGWLTQYAGAPDTPYSRAVGRMLLVAAVRRIREPGVKFDEMVVFEGEQGTAKSSALRMLAVKDDWFVDDFPLDGDGKKVIEAIDGKWIVEAPELSGLSKANVEHLKALLSRGVDRARRPYERLGVDVPRQSIIVGTTNESSYLRDTTGNRRFLPVRINRFDLPALARDRDQLWAEAVQLEKAGGSIRLPGDLWQTAHEEQSARVVEDPLFEILFKDFGDGKAAKVLTSEVWKLVDREPGKQSQADNKRIGESMRRLGFVRKRLRSDGGHAYWYVRGDYEAAAPFERSM